MISPEVEARELARLKKMMQSPAYWRDSDPVLVKAVTQGFEDLYDVPEKDDYEVAATDDLPEARQGQMANILGLNGLKNKSDTYIAHLTPGEIVLPLSAQTKEVMALISQILGEDLPIYTVGSGKEQINPESGLPAFADNFSSTNEIDNKNTIIESQTAADDGRPKVKVPLPSFDQTHCAIFETEANQLTHQIHQKESQIKGFASELSSTLSSIANEVNEVTSTSEYKTATAAIAGLSVATSLVNPMLTFGLAATAAVMTLAQVYTEHYVSDIREIERQMRQLQKEVNTLIGKRDNKLEKFRQCKQTSAV